MADTPFQPHYPHQPLLEIADWLYQSSERLTSQIHYAAQAIVHSVTAGGRVLCAGEAEGQMLAQQAMGLLMQGTGRPRPPLATMCLTPARNPSDPTLAQQVSAWGHPGDVWLAFSLERDAADLKAATAAARELDMTLVIFSGEAAQTLGPLLRDTDVWVPLPGPRAATLFATAWLALDGLGQAVDTCLLGDAAA